MHYLLASSPRGLQDMVTVIGPVKVACTPFTTIAGEVITPKEISSAGSTHIPLWHAWHPAIASAPKPSASANTARMARSYHRFG